MTTPRRADESRAIAATLLVVLVFVLGFVAGCASYPHVPAGCHVYPQGQLYAFTCDADGQP